jgi:hypothetical protein
MFDITGRVPPPPEPTHSDDEDEEDEEDVRMAGIDPPDTLTRTGNSPISTSDAGESNQNSPVSQIAPSPPPAAVRAPPPSPVNHTFGGAESQKMSLSNLMSPQDETHNYSRVHNQAASEASSTHSKLETVTLFIEDKRNELEDIEMVEVTVQVTPGPSGENFWTVDCGELVDRLQEGPSRIDGEFTSSVVKKNIETVSRRNGKSILFAHIRDQKSAKAVCLEA